MSNFDPAVYNEEYENGYVDNKDFNPYVIKNLLTNEEVLSIYNIIKNKENDFLFQPFAGHRAWTFKDETFSNKLNKIITDYIGEPMELKEYSFARYSSKFGYKPKLFPHYDTHSLDGQRITVDIQMNKTRDWAVVVEGQPFNFDIGDALVFSGTQQVHWRENLELDSNDEIDMIFAHFSYIDQKPWSPMQKEILEYHSHRLRESVGISNQPEPLMGFSV
jgi:hypothetical protein